MREREREGKNFVRNGPPSGPRKFLASRHSPIATKLQTCAGTDGDSQNVKRRIDNEAGFELKREETLSIDYMRAEVAHNTCSRSPFAY